MKNITKRILALVLSFVMVVTSLPVIADAATVDVKQDFKNAAFVTVNQGDTIRLTNGKPLSQNDVTGNWSAYKTKEQKFDKTTEIDINSIVVSDKSNMPVKIKEDAKAGFYFIFDAYGKNKERTFKIEIKEKVKKVNVKYTVVAKCGNEVLNNVKGADFPKDGEMKESEYNSITKESMSKYIKSSFEDKGYEYKLTEVSIDKKDGKVTVYATYSKTKLQYFENIRFREIKNGLTSADVKVEEKLYDKIEYVDAFDASQYVKATVVKGDYVYSNPSVTYKRGTQFNKDRVTDTYLYVEYKTVERRYSQTIQVELLGGDATGVSRIQAIKDSRFTKTNSYNVKEYCEKDSKIDYSTILKETFDYNGKSYELDGTPDVSYGPYDNNKNRVVTIKASYKEGKHIKVVHKMSYKLNGKELIPANDQTIKTIDDMFISTEEYNKIKQPKEVNVGAYKLNSNYEFCDAEFNNNTLTIYYSTQRYTVIKEYGDKKPSDNNAAKPVEWTYEILEGNKKYNEYKGPEGEKNLKNIFVIEDVEKVGDKTYKFDKIEAKEEQPGMKTSSIITIKYKEVVYLVYRVSYPDEMKITLSDNDLFYVEAKKDDKRTQEEIDKANAEKIIKDNKFDNSVSIDNVTDWVYDKDKTVIGELIDGIKTIILGFTKGIANPVKLVHQYNFHDVDPKYNKVINISDENIKEREIPRGLQAYDVYESEKLNDGSILDTANLGKESITYSAKDKKVTFNYRARLLLVKSVFLDEEGKEDKNKKATTEEIYVGFDKFDVLGDADYQNKIKDFLKDKQTAENYDLVDVVVTPNAEHRAKKADATYESNTYDDYNVVNVTITFKRNKQAFCEHEYGHYTYNDIDKENDEAGHDKIETCPKCQKELSRVVEEHHYYEEYRGGLFCKECNHLKGFQDTIYAQKRTLSDFSDERMAKILEEIKEEFEDLTDAYFVGIAEPGEIYADADLDDLTLELVNNKSNAKNRVYEGIYEVNGGTFKYVFECQLYSKSKKKNKKQNPTTLLDDPMAQAGGAIETLRTDRPTDSLTRSEFVGVLAEIFKVMDTQNYKDFQDINGDVNEVQIKQYSSFEIVKGYCDQQFGPNDFITREQMYAILARALKFSGKAQALTDEQIDAQLAKVLDNVNVSDWAKVDVANAIEEGIFTSEEKPLDSIQRVEAADKLEKFVAIIYAEAEEEIK